MSSHDENHMADMELSLLEKIDQAGRAKRRVTQRELAEACGLSLGMTNALVHRFSEKGWVRLVRRSTKSVEYSLTAEGMAEKDRRAAGHIELALLKANHYRDRLEAFVNKAKASGATTLILSGQSEMDYIIEGICDQNGLVFVKSADPERATSLARKPGVVLVSSLSSGPGATDGVVSLSSIVAGIA